MVTETSSQPINFQQATLDEKTRLYLGLLALRQPFHLDLSAAPGRLFDQLEDAWPLVDGWDFEANKLQFQIRALAEPLIQRAPASLLHLSINVALGPETPTPSPDNALVQAVFDADHGTVQQCSVGNDALHGSALDAAPVGMTVLYQQKNVEPPALDLDEPPPLIPGPELKVP